MTKGLNELFYEDEIKDCEIIGIEKNYEDHNKE